VLALKCYPCIEAVPTETETDTETETETETETYTKPHPRYSQSPTVSSLTSHNRCAACSSCARALGFFGLHLA